MRGRLGAARAVPAAAVAAAILAGGAASPAHGQSSSDPEVTALRFEGNRTFADEQLRSAIATEATRCKNAMFRFLPPLCPLTGWGLVHDRAYLDRKQLEADLLRLRLFYRRRGYREVAVDSSLTRRDGRVELTFLIEEGRPTLVRRLRIEGVEGIMETERAFELVPLSPGDPLDLTRLERGEQALVDGLRNEGYPRATVLREYFIPAGSREAEVTLRVEPGARARIGSVEVSGISGLSGDFVRRFLRFEPGDLYRRDEIRESQRNLYAVEAVRYASVRTVPRPGTDTLVDVSVEVTEAPMRTVRTGIGFTTTDCAQAEATLTHRNLLGSGRRLGLSATLSNLLAERFQGGPPCAGVGDDPVFQDLNYQVRADFRQPHFLGVRNRLSASLFGGREALPDLYVRSTKGGEVALTRRMGGRSSLGLTYRPERTSFREQSADVFFCVNFGFCTPSDIETLTEPRWLSPLTATWSLDRTDASFFPTSGYYLTVEAETAARLTGSDYRYVRFALNAADFSRVAPDLVFAVRMRTGFVEPERGTTFQVGSREAEVVHPRKRFFAGGPQSVRGFPQFLLGPTVLFLADADERCPGGGLDACVAGLSPDAFDERPVGGNVLTEASFELRQRLSTEWEGVVFLDVGEVAADLSTIGAPTATPGVGVRFFSPVGPLRVDVGYDPTGPARLPVVAEVDGVLTELERRVSFDPVGHDRPSAAREFLRRLQLHLSIGEAF